jgi:diguanylate cyclase (GGDEF)-like protein
MLAAFPIAPAGAGILQFIYPHLPLACATLSIATLILYLNWVDELISVDPLTKLSNRKMLAYYFDQWEQNENSSQDLYIMILDANKFKSINDTYGHVEGDAALVRIADAMTLGCMEHKKRTNLIRYGGDEFLIFAWTKDEEAVNLLAENIKTHLTRLNTEAGAPYELSVSIGITKADRSRPLKEIIDEADDKLYEAKKNLR